MDLTKETMIILAMLEIIREKTDLDKISPKKGEITGMYLIDSEGVLETRDICAYFVNGKPDSLVSIYVMKSNQDWDRFMRFMQKYSEKNGLSFTKAN